MPRRSSPAEPVSSLTLDEPLDTVAAPEHCPGHGSSYEDPLRDPLLPRRQDAANEERDPALVQDAASSHSMNPSLRSRRRPSRLMDRDAAFHQSRGRWRVQNLSQEAARYRYEPTGQQRRLPLTKRVWDDWFYSLAYQKTFVLMMILFVSYGAIVGLFAFVYLGVSVWGEEKKVNPDGSISKTAFCDMDIHDHMEALYFSLSTMTTIGYGVSDYYFGGCWTPLLLVLAQVCCAITFDAVAIGLLFQRISRGHKRGKTIMFSDCAVVQRVAGKLHVMFRMAELRSHQLRDVSVKAYCIRHERLPVPGSDTRETHVETTHFVTRPLQLLHEKVAGHTNILMSLPQVLVHCLDENSPLKQPEEWYGEDGIHHKASEDSENTEVIAGGPSGDVAATRALETDETAAFLRDRQTEIVVMVEGTDELTGAAIQARHSYNVHDLAWNQAFAPCIFPYEEGRHNLRQSSCCRKRTPPACVVDFQAFHDLRPVPDNVVASPYVYE